MAAKKTTTPKKIGGIKSVSVDPRREYVSGGILTGGNRTLSSRIDDISREVSSNVYEQMLNDPEISKCHNILKISVLGDGVELIPAVPEKHPDFEQAAEISYFCTTTITGLKRPLRDTLEQMMDAIAFGHKIAEITYKTGTMNGFDGQKLLLDMIKVKPRNAVNFVVDNRLNVLGFIGRLASEDIQQASAGNELLKISQGENGSTINGKPILPREKFMVLTIRSKDEDPRGQSMLRPAFNAWQLKNQVWPEYLRYLLVCAIPLLVGTTAPDESNGADFQRDLSGNPLTDSEGRYIQVNPVEALRDALSQARNATTVALKNGSDVKEIGGGGAGTPFYKAIETFDRQIESAILMQTLATSEGSHQSRAASETHMSILDLLVYWLKGAVVDMITADLLRPLVRYNFGESMLDLVPKISLGSGDRHTFAEDGNTIANLFKVGYFQPDQLKEADLQLGFTPRDDVDPLHLVQQLQDAGVPILAVPPDPTHVAEVQAGPTGGQSPVPVKSGASLPTGKRVDSSQSTLAKAKSTRASGLKFPALGRKKKALNKTSASKNTES